MYDIHPNVSLVAAYNKRKQEYIMRLYILGSHEPNIACNLQHVKCSIKYQNNFMCCHLLSLCVVDNVIRINPGSIPTSVFK
jgi:hypothetical protein